MNVPAGVTNKHTGETFLRGKTDQGKLNQVEKKSIPQMTSQEKEKPLQKEEHIPVTDKATVISSVEKEKITAKSLKVRVNNILGTEGATGLPGYQPGKISSPVSVQKQEVQPLKSEPHVKQSDQKLLDYIEKADILKEKAKKITHTTHVEVSDNGSPPPPPADSTVKLSGRVEAQSILDNAYHQAVVLNKEANQTRAGAREKAKPLRVEANKIIADAESEYKRLHDDANKIIDKAGKEANNLNREAGNQKTNKERRKELTRKASEILKKAKDEADKILKLAADIVKQAHSKAHEKQKNATDIINQGGKDAHTKENKAQEIINEAHKEYLKAKGEKAGSKASNEQIKKDFPKLEGIADKLYVEDLEKPVVAENLEDLSRVPGNILKKLADKGVTFYVGNRSVPGLDKNQDKAGKKPTGWDDGRTWDVVAGCYNPRDNTVSAGRGSEDSTGLAIHETGHAIGDRFTTKEGNKDVKINDSKELVEAHKRFYKNLPPYFQQEGPGGLAGRKELLAESIAVYLKEGKDAAVKRYDAAYVDFLENKVLK